MAETRKSAGAWETASKTVPADLTGAARTKAIDEAYIKASMGPDVDVDAEMEKMREANKRIIDMMEAVNAGNVDKDFTFYDVNGNPTTWQVRGGQIRNLEMVEAGSGKLPDVSGLSADSRVRKAYEKELVGGTFGERLKEVGYNFKDIPEVGRNGGEIAAICASSGLPWCGGFTKMQFDRVFGNQVWLQKNPLWAASFEAYGIQHGAYHPNGKGDKPEIGDVITLRGGGRSGQHPAILVGWADNGDMILSAGNHGNKAAIFQRSLGSATVYGWTSVSELMMARAQKGTAVLGPDGMPILSLNDTPGQDVQPKDWVPQLFADKGKVALGRTVGQLLAGGEMPGGIKLSGADVAARTAQLDRDGNGKIERADFDVDGDGQITDGDITKLGELGVTGGADKTVIESVIQHVVKVANEPAAPAK